MFKKIIYSILLILILGVVLALGFAVFNFPRMQTFQTTDLKVTAPLQNAVITSPLDIEGEALGSWYFEAVFPISVTDTNGNILGQGQAEAASDWMTTSSVPFKATIEFATSSTPTGFIVFRNDNPSGLPQNAKEAKMFVRF